jgi:hypothetical protein
MCVSTEGRIAGDYPSLPGRLEDRMQAKISLLDPKEKTQRRAANGKVQKEIDTHVNKSDILNLTGAKVFSLVEKLRE